MASVGFLYFTVLASNQRHSLALPCMLTGRALSERVLKALMGEHVWWSWVVSEVHLGFLFSICWFGAETIEPSI